MNANSPELPHLGKFRPADVQVKFLISPFAHFAWRWRGIGFCQENRDARFWDFSKDLGFIMALGYGRIIVVTQVCGICGAAAATHDVRSGVRC
jgi:hypothetical protein